MKSVKRIFAMIVLLLVCTAGFAQTKKMSANGVTVPDWMANCVILRSNAVFSSNRTIGTAVGTRQDDVTIKSISINGNTLEMVFLKGPKPSEPEQKLTLQFECAKSGNAGSCYLSFIKVELVLKFRSAEEWCSGPYDEYRYGRCLGSLKEVSNYFFVDTVLQAEKKAAEKAAEERRIAEEKAAEERRLQKEAEAKERRKTYINEWIETGIVPIDDVAYFINYMKNSPKELTIKAQGNISDDAELKNIGTAIKEYPASVSLDLSEVSIQKIPLNSFSSCKNLKSITLPDGLKSIDSSFIGSGLTEIEIPKSVREIENMAFWGCTSLQKVTLPNLPENVAVFREMDIMREYIFENCTALQLIQFYGSKNQWDELGIKVPDGCKIKYNYDPVREEQERIAAEKAEQERIAAEKAEQERIAAEKKAAEEKRIAEEKARAERKAAEEKKVQELTAKANKGDAQAQADLGSFYFNGGEFIAADYVKAFDLFSKAAAQGNPRGINGLRVCYQYGIGVQKNEKKAIEFYTKAAKLGFDTAQRNLGICYYNGYGVKQNYKKAVQYFEQSAEQGNSYAQYSLGLCYYNGEGVKKNYEKAVQYFEQLAEQGNSDAQYSLGLCYYNGEGVKKNYEKAVQYFEQLAEQGNSYAQYRLGICYLNGKGVKLNREKAVQYFEQSAEQGNSDAQCELGECYLNGYGVKQNYEKAVQYFEQSAEQGNSDAQYRLGLCYYYGEGVEKNLSKAIMLLKQSADAGNEDARRALGR